MGTLGLITAKKTLYVANVDETDVHGEGPLTQKVRAEFIGRGKYQILPQATGVDALLTGEVTSVSIVPSAFAANQLASRYALTMTARIELRNMRDNTVLWENPASVRFRRGGETQLSVFRRASSTADHTLAHFEVSDIEVVVRELEGREVSFIDYAEGPLQTGGHIAQVGPARAAWFRDPDGNTLGLREG